MVAPLVVGRRKSIQALEDAMEKRTEIFLVAQKDSTVDEPKKNQIFSVGTLAVVMQLLRLPDGTIKALIEGKRRGKIVSYVPNDNFLQVEVLEIADEAGKKGEVLAYERELRKFFDEFATINKKISKEVVKSVNNIEDPAKLVDIICAHMPLKADEKQKILEAETVILRIEKVLEYIYREIELAELEKAINAKVKMRMAKTQRNYYLGEKVREIQSEMGHGDDGLDDIAELEKAIKKKKLPALAKEKITKELRKLKSMPPMSAETTVVRNYIDCILSLPWKKKSKAEIDINRAEKILDEDHYGLAKPKERIVEYLAVQAQVQKIKGPILCLVGPPGVGKTSICKSIARSMNREFVRLSLGGVRDEAEIRGHRRTYIGATRAR
jgi:ATP-dependent Lon protease